ncbi:hypothetical protein NDU88_009842 [Pleurodeles waltl]|uniref:Uncharacterized protein n=1 Tax=Pleurodeles waltl TaxID=8319 RepID=A0AAV7QSP7_PLEWA|nr:hypothetical protein NDU88_009842 [Pleurodeles waltl]
MPDIIIHIQKVFSEFLSTAITFQACSYHMPISGHDMRQLSSATSTAIKCKKRAGRPAARAPRQSRGHGRARTSRRRLASPRRQIVLSTALTRAGTRGE